VRRPRLLIVITLAETGGAQSYVAALLPALVEELDVTVAAGGDGFLRRATEAAGARYVPLAHMVRQLDPREDMRGLLELIWLMRRLRPDIVHANSSKAGVLGRLAAALTRVPVRIFTVHGWAFKAHEGVAAAVYLWADRAMRPLTTRTICVAESERAAGLRARTCGAAGTVVIRNGVALDRPRHRPGNATDDAMTVLSVGRLRAPKDFPVLVRAAEQLPPATARIAIAGDGPDRAGIEAAIRHDGGAPVELLGERDDVPELLAAADVFVLPSRSEGMPLSVLEAMAAGVPVVASAVGGVPELVVDGVTGVLVPPGDAAALAAALARLAGDAAERERMGAAARRRAEAEFGIEACRRRHLDLYRATLARARGTSRARR
jgi:glycosyltransferase involved in cell wall biosynthesis